MRYDWKFWLVVGVLFVALTYGGVQVMTKTSEERRLSGLLPEVRSHLEMVRQELANRGIQTHVGQTLRTGQQQDNLVKEGKSATSNSWHEVGRAVDLYPRNKKGQPDFGVESLDNYRVMHEIAARHGFRGLAFNTDGTRRFAVKGKWDGGHIEYRGGLTYSQAVANFNAQQRKA